MFQRDGEIEVEIQWYDEITGTWVECNIQPPGDRTPSEHIYLMRKLAKDIGDDNPVQYRTVTTVYDIKGL
jgi:hypothetical protein